MSRNRSSSPHIVVVCEFGTLNGGEQSLLSVLDEMRFRSSVSPRVTVLAPGKGRFIEALHSRQIAHFPFQFALDAGRLPREEIQRRLIETLRQLAPNLVHANSLSMGRLVGSVRDQITIPCLSHIRDIVRVSRAAVNDLNRLDRLIAVSNATREFHVAQGINRENVAVVYNGVDSTRFAPGPRTGELLRELKLDEGAFLVATIGQIGLRKGQDVLADAAALLRRRFGHVHYIIIGERNSAKEENRLFEERLHQQFADAGLAERVHYLGYRADMPAILREIDLLVHPARQEPLGRVLLEAGASGLPTIATNVGGTAEIFPAGEAVLIEPYDPHQLATRMAELIRDRSRRQQLGESARQRIVNTFSTRSAATDLYNIWIAYL